MSPPAPVAPAVVSADAPAPAPSQRVRLAPRPRVPSVIERLSDPMPTDRLVGWLVAIAIAAVAFVIRLVNLATPSRLVFDETYYPKDAWTLWQFGYEKEWGKGEVVNPQIVAGDPSGFSDSAAFVVHPPLGKWLIGAGEQLFGMNSFGWRFPSLVFGTIMIIIVVLMVRRLARSTMIGALAGVLLSFDGLHFAMSRIGLLDIFMATFVLGAVACLLADRDWFRHRLARWLVGTGQSDLGGRYGPPLWFRPWRIGAGVLFGLACATKWNALYLLAAFAVLSLAWDIGARRLAGAGPQAWRGLFLDGIPAFVSTVVVGLVVYVSSWTGWLVTDGGYDRDWGENNPEALSTRVLGRPLASLLQYHADIYGFHSGQFIKDATHPYDAHPMGWLVMARPIGIDAVNDIQPGVNGCPVTAEKCLSVISGAGTPLLWWIGLVALVFAAFFWIGTRDWRFGVPIVGLAAAWLPWFAVADRPQFFFYAIMIIPFTVTALALCCGKIIGPPERGERRMLGAIVVGVVVALVGANFAFMYPILTDRVIPYPDWLARMWFRSWI